MLTRGALAPATFTFIDLFAGIGGMRLGFQSAGGKCVYTSEWDKYARRTYEANFEVGHPIDGDIRGVPSQAIPEHDLLVAGFPCQPFSLAGVSKKNSLGKAHGFECTTQGTLFFEIERILRHHRPVAFLLENVKNLRSHDRGNTWKVIRHTLESDLGYQIYPMVVDARVVVPQHRERVFIVGFSEPRNFDWQDIDLPAAGSGPRLNSILHRPSDALLDGGRFTNSDGEALPKYVVGPGTWETLRRHAEHHRGRGNGFGYGVVTANDVARTLSARYHKDGAEILVDRGEGLRPRRLTPRECARLMGYPDAFRIPATVSDTQAYRQFGNSVVPGVVAAVARLMRPHVLDLKRRNAESEFAGQADGGYR